MPVDPLVLLAFIPASLALNLTPGVDMMFCFGQGLRYGPRAALAADAGIAFGGLLHVTVAGLGLGAVMAAAPWTFEAIRWLGVTYLLWLAWGALRAEPMDEAQVPLRRSQAFRDGMLTNLTNPKMILFVLAFIPQFVDPSRGNVLAQFLIFGAALSLGRLFVNGAVGVFAGGIGRRLARSARFAQILGYVSAGVFGALALRLAVLEK